MKVYICSARTGYANRDFVKFAKIEKKLIKLGLQPVNPLRIVDSQEVQLRLAERDTFIDETLFAKFGEEKRYQYLSMLLLAGFLVGCDAIYLERDWSEDLPCFVEFSLSQMLGLRAVELIRGELRDADVSNIRFPLIVMPPSPRIEPSTDGDQEDDEDNRFYDDAYDNLIEGESDDDYHQPDPEPRNVEDLYRDRQNLYRSISPEAVEKLQSMFDEEKPSSRKIKPGTGAWLEEQMRSNRRKRGTGDG